MKRTEIRLLHGDITLNTYCTETGEVADKAQLMVLTDCTVNGLVVNHNFKIVHNGETLNVKVSYNNERDTYIIHVIRPAQNVGMRTLSVPNAPKAAYGKKTSKPGRAFPMDPLNDSVRVD